MSAVMGPQGPQQGILSKPTEPPKQGGITKQVTDQMMSSAPPAMRANVERIVTAGKLLMYNPKTHELMIQQLQSFNAGNVADKLAQGIAALITMIKNESRGPFPADAVPPAAVILLMDVMDFLSGAGKLEITEGLIAEATEELLGYLAQKLGIGPEQIQMAQSGQVPEPTQPSAPPQRGILGGA